MSRPIKCRRVSFYPETRYFKPAGIPMKDLKEECLSMEEVESIRLKDLEGLDQEQGAARMNISRPTFQRVLTSAHQKIAGALLQGKAIRIEGGSFEISPCHFKCALGHEWDVSFEYVVKKHPEACPICQTAEINCSHQFGKGCESHGHIRCCQKDRFPLDQTDQSDSCEAKK
jgi:uncharacterized protein